MSKIDQANAWYFGLEQCIGLGHKLWNERDGHADVVFDVQAFIDLSQRNGFSNLPKTLGLRQTFSDHSICDPAIFHGCFHQSLKAHTGMCFRLVVRVFKQDAPRCFFEKWHSELGVMFVDQTQCKLPHHFKTSEARAQSLMCQTQQ